jgi:hypothetical protein
MSLEQAVAILSGAAVIMLLAVVAVVIVIVRAVRPR